MPDEAVAVAVVLSADDVLSELVQHRVHVWSLGRLLG